MSVQRVTTAADQFMALVSVLRKANLEETHGLRLALRVLIENWDDLYEPVGGTVIGEGSVRCFEQGVCELSWSNCSTLVEFRDAWRSKVADDVESKLRSEYEARVENVRMSTTQIRLPRADLASHCVEEPLQTIVPMCSVCWSTESRLHLDHVIPRSKGGDNSYANYQLLCNQCNSSKSDKDMDEWMEYVNTSDSEGAANIRRRRDTNRAIALFGGTP